jgi:hypothetical protein
MANEYAIKMWDDYAKEVGGKTVDGKPLPAWEELPEAEQRSWQAMATRVVDRAERLEKAIAKARSVARAARENKDG